MELLEETSLKGGDGYRYKSAIYRDNGRLAVVTPYKPWLIAEIKNMEGATYHGFDKVNPRKIWTIADSRRNRFQLAFLKGENPYGHYDIPLSKAKEIYDIPTQRFNKLQQKTVDLFEHQYEEFIPHCLLRHYCILAGEMGTAKSLAVIVAMELALRYHSQQLIDFYASKGVAINENELGLWYIAPRSAIKAVERELKIWDSPIRNRSDFAMMTYEGCASRVQNWTPGKRAPFFIWADESSRVKTPNAQRSICLKKLSQEVMDHWGPMGYVIESTGSPAPKSPLDWWMQAEIACPGFLREGDINKFKRRLAVIVMREDSTGGSYPQLIRWKDDPTKCNVCGKDKTDPCHEMTPEAVITGSGHQWEPSVNEVANLYKRLKGLVLVKFKKDCLNLPDIIYREIEIKPDAKTLRAAALIVKTSKTVIEARTFLRELSDGFQYVQEKVGTEVCPRCHGTLEAVEPTEIPETCPNCKGTNKKFWDESTQIMVNQCGNHSPQYNQVKCKCPNCDNGQVPRFGRKIKEVAGPKDEVIKDLLDEYDEVGRVNIFASFTASIDRCCRIAQKKGWAIIRIDEGKERIFNYDGLPLTVNPDGSKISYLTLFQDQKTDYPRVAYIANPGSGGIGTTLTASPVTIYFNNGDKAEDRIQSEARHHRPGMDIEKGATVIDLIHLPTDRKILNDLKNKRDLQNQTLGEFSEALKETGDGYVERY